MKIYSIKDTKVGFNNPVVFVNDSVAIRSFTSFANNQTDSLIFNNPSDYELWCLGTFDSDSGIITSDVRFIKSALEVKNNG